MCSHFVRRAFPFVTLLAALVLGGVGCQPQTIVLASVATDQAPKPPMKKMLVLGARLGEGDRRAIEGGFATGLRARGVDAHPAFELFPVPPRDREQARATLLANGYEGLLIVALAKVEDEQCGSLGAENGAPVGVRRQGLRPDSAGVGRMRGGFGQVMEIGAKGDAEFACNAVFDRVQHPPRGRDGGGDGAAGVVRLRSGAALRTKGYQLIPAGDRLVLELPGGGGIGPAAERGLAAQARDVRDGLVTASSSSGTGLG